MGHCIFLLSFYFPGLVMQVKETTDTGEVSCTSRSCMKVRPWSEHPHLHEYLLADIISIVHPLTTCGYGGQCSVSEIEKYWNAK